MGRKNKQATNRHYNDSNNNKPNKPNQTMYLRILPLLIVTIIHTPIYCSYFVVREPFLSVMLYLMNLVQESKKNSHRPNW
jgi:hypothetical protein